MLGTFDEETTPSAVAIGNGTDYVVDGKPTIAFVENLVDNLAGKFISQVINFVSTLVLTINYYFLCVF